MMRRIVASSLKFRRLIVALAIGLIAVGVTQVGNIPVDQLPEFGPTMVEVRTEALGLSATEVEQLITVPLEQDLLNGIAFVDEIHSESLPGLSSVVMVFEPGTALLDARQVVQEKVSEAAVALPGVSAPPQMLQPYSSTSRVLSVRLSSETMPPIKMSELAKWTIAPRLLGVQGVANVSIWGFRDRQLQVLVDPDRLRDADLTLQQIINTTGNSLWASPLTFLEASTPGTAGFIDTPNQRFGIRHENPIKTADDLAQIPIEDDEGNAVIVDGQSVLLGDVTELVEDHQPLIGDTVFPEGKSGLMLVVEKFPDANTVEVTHGVEEALDSLSEGLGGMEVDTSLFRPADYVETSTGNVAMALAIGGLLLIAVLVLLLASWRSVVTAVAAIVASLAVAGTILVVRDVTLNVMLLAGSGDGDRDRGRRRRHGRASDRGRAQSADRDRRARVAEGAGCLARGAELAPLRDDHRDRRGRARLLPGRPGGRVPAPGPRFLPARRRRLDAGRAHPHARPGPDAPAQAPPGHGSHRSSAGSRDGTSRA